MLPDVRHATLGIGAGGTIRQHIEHDTYDPRIWDVASSKILNIQIINSTAFRMVTGLDPPESPIMPSVYFDMGLPFYKLWRDETQKDGVAGVWGSLMGVAEAASKISKRGGKMGMAEASDRMGSWGLRKSGIWGRIGEGESRTEEGEVAGEEGIKEPSFDLPAVLLDVDDTVLPFRSVVEDAWEGIQVGMFT